MVVNGLNSAGLFTADAATFVITEVTEDLTLQISVENDTGILTSFTEMYSPDANNNVTLYGLHKLARTYIMMPPLLDTSALYPSYVTIRVQYLSDNTLHSLFSQKFYYCRQRISGMDGSFSGFLSRYKVRKIRLGQPVYCSFIDNNQEFQLAVAYRTAEKAKYIVMDIEVPPYPGAISEFNISSSKIVEYMAAITHISIAEEDIIYCDAILRNTDGLIVDRIRHEVDQRYFPQQTVMVFYNLFGVTDSLVLTGKLEQEAEMSATYGTIGGQFLKIDTSLQDKYIANTGFLDKAGQGALKDLVASPSVRLMNDRKLGDVITVTDVSAVTVKPATEPTNFKITYKLVDGGEESFSRETDTRIFDKTFDYTFD